MKLVPLFEEGEKNVLTGKGSDFYSISPDGVCKITDKEKFRQAVIDAFKAEAKNEDSDGEFRAKERQWYSKAKILDTHLYELKYKYDNITNVVIADFERHIKGVLKKLIADGLVEETTQTGQYKNYRFTKKFKRTNEAKGELKLSDALVKLITDKKITEKDFRGLASAEEITQKEANDIEFMKGRIDTWIGNEMIEKTK